MAHGSGGEASLSVIVSSVGEARAAVLGQGLHYMHIEFKGTFYFSETVTSHSAA